MIDSYELASKISKLDVGQGFDILDETYGNSIRVRKFDDSISTYISIFSPWGDVDIHMPSYKSPAVSDELDVIIGTAKISRSFLMNAHYAQIEP